jgi:hypothetical protein
MHVDVHAVLPGGFADVDADVEAVGRMLFQQQLPRFIQ